MNNFIVSARKYRPATFESVVGQAHITSTLRNAISRGQLAHAYLFCGPRGVGKTTCARIFAKAINCQNPTSASEACGECESCRSFEEGRSFNIHELDAASNNSVDDIRSLTEQVRIPPQIGRYSVYIIDEVHMLSASAFNAFLKTLEEPPAHAIFILATTEKHKIIPTILSRCQIYDFNRIRVEDGVGYLKYIASQEGVSSDDESLHLIAQKADGGMRDALSMFDKAVAFCGSVLDFKEVARTLNVLDYDTYFGVTDAIHESDYKRTLVMFDEVLGKGFSGQTFIAGLNSHFRDLLMCKDPQTLSLLEVTGSLLDRYTQQSAKIETDFLFGAVSLMSAVDSQLRAATNQRLHIELGLMKLCGLGQKKNSLNNSTESPVLPDFNKSTDGVKSANVDTSNDSPQSAGVRQTNGATTQTTAAGAPAAPRQSGTEAPTAHNNGTQEQPYARPSTPAQRTGDSAKSVSGVSLNNILNKNRNKKAAAEENPAVCENKEITPIDADCESKLSAAKEEFLETLSTRRPRFATALADMRIEGNIIRASVSSDILRDELTFHQKEIINTLCDLAGVDGIVKLEIEVKENTKSLRPVKPEDKLAYLTAKNPLLTDLRRVLELEME